MSNVPKLRFKEFSGEWEEKKYGDIYSFHTTNSFSRDNLNYENGNVFNIHYGDIHTKFSTMFHLENEEVPYINPDVKIDNIRDENYCQIGDLVIADASEDYNDVGKTMEIISLNNSKTVAGLHTFLARPNKYDMALGYAGYMLQSWKVRKQVMQIAQGTKVLGIATGRLSKIKLDIPLKQEQEKIASFLTSVDAKIEQLTKKESLLSSYKKGVMQKIFSGEIRFKADDGSEFCEWEEKKLEDISTAHYQGINTTADKLEYFKNGFPILQAKHITNEIIDMEDVRYVDLNTYNSYKQKFQPLVNDLLISNIGTLGKIVLVEEAFNFLIAWNIFKVTLKTNVDSKFIMYSLKKIAQEGYFERMQTGNATKFVNKGDMLSIIFQLPCLEEQTKIANFLSSIDAKIEQVQKQLNSTKEFKKALLQQMFV